MVTENRPAMKRLNLWGSTWNPETRSKSQWLQSFIIGCFKSRQKLSTWCCLCLVWSVAVVFSPFLTFGNFLRYIHHLPPSSTSSYGAILELLELFHLRQIRIVAVVIHQSADPQLLAHGQQHQSSLPWQLDQPKNCCPPLELQKVKWSTTSLHPLTFWNVVMWELLVAPSCWRSKIDTHSSAPLPPFTTGYFSVFPCVSLDSEDPCDGKNWIFRLDTRICIPMDTWRIPYKIH